MSSAASGLTITSSSNAPTTTNAVSEEDTEFIEQWKLKRLLQKLDAMEGGGTSMVSLVIPPRDQLCRVSRLLVEEAGTASNIKSRVNRQSVLTAIASAQQRLKLYSRVPERGLVVFCGSAMVGDKEKRVAIDFEPYKAVTRPVYWCGPKFQTGAVAELLQNEDTFGIIVVDGNGALYGTVNGNRRTVLQRFTVDLPKKHNKGGQSSNRFARIRIEKRHNYVRKVAELANTLFLNSGGTNLPNVTSLVLAGSAEFKSDLLNSDLFDPRLQKIVVATVDISYGGENGFNQAIDLAQESMGDVRLVRERRIIRSFLSAIATDGNYIFGARETVAALEQGAVETLIVWEGLTCSRIELKMTNQSESNERRIVYSNSSSYQVTEGFEIVSQEPFIDWITENYRKFGSALSLVSDRSPEGSQLARGFGGIGGLLRYRLTDDAVPTLTDSTDIGDDEYSGDPDSVDFI